jgi:hypothetical protein
MGCRQSKSAAVNALSKNSSNNNNDNGGSVDRTKTKLSKQHVDDDDALTNQPTQEILSPTTNNTSVNHPATTNSNNDKHHSTSSTTIIKNTTKNTKQAHTVPPPPLPGRVAAGAAAARKNGASSATTTASASNSNSLRSSDRVYKLLLKSTQNSQSKTRRNDMKGSSTAAAAGEAAATTTVVVLDDKAVLQAMSPSAASYRNPTTQSSPLHLAVQLIDCHTMATSTTQSTSVILNKEKHQQQPKELKSSSSSSSALLQVITELIRAYPDAVFTPDIYGYIPLHYAIAPTTTSTSVATTTTTPSKAPSTQQLIPSNKKNKSTIGAIIGSSSPIKTQQERQILQDLEDLQHQQQQQQLLSSVWHLRTSIVKVLLQSDTSTASYNYMTRNDVVYNNNTNSNSTNTATTMNAGGCTPLYRVLQMIPDDSKIQNAPTLEYVHLLLKFIAQHQSHIATTTGTDDNTATGMTMLSTPTTPMVCIGNNYDGDKPLSLLYRRFTRQFDVSEQFFTGDNSRSEVVEHRQRYKIAASNTWKIIELCIKQQQQQQPIPIVTTAADLDGTHNGPTSQHNNNHKNHNYVRTSYRIVHRAVQGETPPDLLRYIIETNADELTVADEAGNLPLHYAARYRPKEIAEANALPSDNSNNDTGKTRYDKKSSFPAFYSKYVMDELLYKYPEAASVPDLYGHYPLYLAVQSGKQWIGGGIKSLYDAYPDAVQQIDISKYPSFQRALLMDQNYIAFTNTLDNDIEYEHKEEKKQQIDIVRDEQHDAIMLVQDENVDISEVVTSMWAHEEDAGVQMLGCIAIRRLLNQSQQQQLGTNTTDNKDDRIESSLRIALSAVPAVVNAMKAHPNEVIVQEKACHTLRAMAVADGYREVSFVASGAVAAVVGAMQAHVSDPNVQEEACGAIGQILHYGGTDRATVVASVSGVTAILNAIAAHPTIVGVQREGCIALRELTNYSDTANLPELPRSQTEALLEQAKNAFPIDCTESVDILLSRLI